MTIMNAKKKDGNKMIIGMSYARPTPDRSKTVTFYQRQKHLILARNMSDTSRRVKKMCPASIYFFTHVPSSLRLGDDDTGHNKLSPRLSFVFLCLPRAGEHRENSSDICIDLYGCELSKGRKMKSWAQKKWRQPDQLRVSAYTVWTLSCHERCTEGNIRRARREGKVCPFGWQRLKIRTWRKGPVGKLRNIQTAQNA